MRYLNLIKVFLAIKLITVPLYAIAEGNENCGCDKQQSDSQDSSTCDTYATNSMSHETLQSSEHKINEQVQKLFANESDLPDITVTTANGVVILSGAASDQAQVDKAAYLASTVPCVTEVDTSKFYVQ